MSEIEMQVEGVLRVSGRCVGQVMTAIDDGHGTLWIIDYQESPYAAAFEDRRVVVSGEPFSPGHLVPHIIGSPGFHTVRHFRVSSIRLAE